MVDLEDLAQHFETVSEPDVATAERACAVIADHRAEAHAGRAIAPDDLASTDVVVHLADEIVPGWSIRILGKALEQDGHWDCHLRRTTSRDNDEFVGHGRGKVLSYAVLAALLRVLEYRTGGHRLT